MSSQGLDSNSNWRIIEQTWLKEGCGQEFRPKVFWPGFSSNLHSSFLPPFFLPGSGGGRLAPPGEDYLLKPFY